MPMTIVVATATAHGALTKSMAELASDTMHSTTTAAFAAASDPTDAMAMTPC